MNASITLFAENFNIDPEEVNKFCFANNIAITKVKKEKKEKEKKEKKEKKVKKISGYFLHNSEVRQEITKEVKEKCDKSGTEFNQRVVLTALGAHWSNLNSEEKEIWNLKAKEKNDSEMSSSVTSDDESEKPKKPKRLPSGYILHNSEYRAIITKELKEKAEKSGEKFLTQSVLGALGTHWKELSDEERNMWNDKSKEIADIE